MNRYNLVVHGVRLHVLDHPGGATTLILLHGLAASAAIFETLITSGLSPRFHVVAPDLRGRGRSEAPPLANDPNTPAAPYTMADHAADVLGLLDRLNLGQAVLVGHSFGGMLALHLAAHHPERFPRLVVLDWAAALATPATLTLLKPTLDRLGQIVPSWERYRDGLRRLPFLDGWWDAAIERYFRDDVILLEDGGVRGRCDPQAVRAAIEGTLLEDWPAILAQVFQPTLLIQGEGPFGPPGAPPFLSREAALATVRALGQGRFMSVSGNHITMLFGDHASRLAQAIGDFASGGLVGDDPD
jgi:pimeloyl-ACP methyl ester carboxylesterase